MFKAEDNLVKRYQLQQQLGRTAVGHQTWLAIDRQTQEQVTLKLLAFNPQMQWEELKLFEREAQILETLNHPRIPRYRDYFDIDKNEGNGLPWFALVQDYIPGASLLELLEEGKRFSEKEVRFIAQEVLEILIYLHELSPPVLHRDIKPSNLIMGEDSHIYLVDFGAVQAQAAVTGVTFTIVGTSGYAPLEQFWGRAVPASDIYALGATLIHLLTGIAPVDLPQKDYRIQFSDRVNIKPDLLSWLERVTDIAIDKRFKNSREALKAFQSGKIQRISKSQSNQFRKVAQPEKTKIKLNKFEDRLEIYIPTGWGNRSGELILIVLNFFENIILIILFLIPTIFLYLLLILFSAFSLMNSLVITFLFLLSISFALMPLTSLLIKKIYLNIDLKELCIKRKYLTNNFTHRKCNTSDIYSIFVDNKENNYRVSIRSRTGVYYLGGALSEHESAWLAQEIRDWLNLQQFSPPLPPKEGGNSFKVPQYWGASAVLGFPQVERLAWI